MIQPRKGQIQRDILYHFASDLDKRKKKWWAVPELAHEIYPEIRHVKPPRAFFTTEFKYLIKKVQHSLVRLDKRGFMKRGWKRSMLHTAFWHITEKGIEEAIKVYYETHDMRRASARRTDGD